jgi:hypothetical protein
VAGNFAVTARPEGTLETTSHSFVLSGQSDTTLPYQPPCSWLISLCRFTTGKWFLQSKFKSPNDNSEVIIYQVSPDLNVPLFAKNHPGLAKMPY